MNYKKLTKKWVSFTKLKRRENCHLAFIFKGNRLLAVGRNKYLHNSSGHRFTIHAEVNALKKVDLKYASKYVMLVIRIRSNGQLGMSKPCARCQDILKQFSIEHVWYSTDNGSFEKL